MTVCAWDLLRANRRPLILIFILAKLVFITFCIYSLKTLESVNQLQWEMTRRYINLEPSALNRTPDTPLMLIYNRIPRTGGTTLKSLLEDVGHETGYIHRSSKENNFRQLTQEEERMFVRDLIEEMQLFVFPFSFDRMVYYTNFTRQGVPRPIYISLLRDPVERAASLFYSKQISGNASVLLKDSVQDVFGECILHAYPECKMEDGQFLETSVTYFCGSDPECLILNSRTALQKAKFVLETEYSVVGILEMFKDSLKVMEKYIPAYARTMYMTYRRWDRLLRIRNSVPHPVVSQRAQKVLKHRLRAEYELYEFAKQRLEKQIQSIDLMV